MLKHNTFIFLYILLLNSVGHKNIEGDLDHLNIDAAMGLTDECWVMEMTDNGACNGNGFCSRSYDDFDINCSCFQGFSGNSCQFYVEELACSELDCGFSGIQGECVIGANSDALCICYPGWYGENCALNTTKDSVDYCEGILCNNHGDCVADQSAEAEYSCECHTGFSGMDCSLELSECGHEFLLDMYVRLAMLSGDLMSTLECGYAKPVIYSAGMPSYSDPMTYPYCVCASIMETFGMADYTHMQSVCVMDKYRDLPFIEEAQSYCPNCDEFQDAVMEEVITSKSAACYHFVYRRSEMPLYWRSRWKCGCVMDVGNQASTETIVNCPFTQHTASSDYISYDNCGGGKVCDWQAMYSYFEIEFAQIYLEGSVICKKWMEEWIFTVPGEQRFEYMATSFCPCLGALKGTGYDLDSILDCIPVTFHQLTMRDKYEQICYDPYITNVACLNSIAYASIELAVSNYTAAAMC